MARGLSEQAHQKVLEAAAELFAERGIDAASMDAIAAAAAVSKATVYKHWADKDALCMEVLLHVHRRDEGPPEGDSGDLKADLKAFLGYEPSAETASMQKRLAPHLIAYSAKNQEFGRAWRARITERARTALRKFLRRGIEQGIFTVVLDEELSVALLWGPMMYRHIFGPAVSRQWLAEGVVESFWRAHARMDLEVAGQNLKSGSRKKRR
jgi:AcrR family transcriptional regulator